MTEKEEKKMHKKQRRKKEKQIFPDACGKALQSRV